MAEQVCSPRINAPLLDSFTTKTVRIVGKVKELRGDTATIDAVGVITVHLNRVCHLPLSIYSIPIPSLHLMNIPERKKI